MVDGQCGTKGWRAPEMEEKSMYSPIKADRWSTGQVLLCLLNKFKKEDTILRTIARKLITHNPEWRSSMLQVAASLSDVVNVAVEKKASRSLQDTAEVDGENVKTLRVKKQKLSVPDRMCREISVNGLFNGSFLDLGARSSRAYRGLYVVSACNIYTYLYLCPSSVNLHKTFLGLLKLEQVKKYEKYEKCKSNLFFFAKS